MMNEIKDVNVISGICVQNDNLVTGYVFKIVYADNSKEYYKAFFKDEDTYFVVINFINSISNVNNVKFNSIFDLKGKISLTTCFNSCKFNNLKELNDWLNRFNH